jgi:hypothetical protein
MGHGYPAAKIGFQPTIPFIPLWFGSYEKEICMPILYRKNKNKNSIGMLIHEFFFKIMFSNNARLSSVVIII